MGSPLQEQISAAVQGARAGLGVGALHRSGQGKFAQHWGGRGKGARLRVHTSRWHSQNLLLQQAASRRGSHVGDVLLYGQLTLIVIVCLKHSKTTVGEKKIPTPLGWPFSPQPC